MIARRLAFAALWAVVVVGCRRPLAAERDVEVDAGVSHLDLRTAGSATTPPPYPWPPHADASVADVEANGKPPDPPPSPPCAAQAQTRWSCRAGGVARAPGVIGRIVKVEVVGGDQQIVIAVGTIQGIATGWTAVLLRGDTDLPLDGGAIDIVRIGRTTTLGRVRVTADQVQSSSRVRFTPPP